jgi:hypothetical protein
VFKHLRDTGAACVAVASALCSNMLNDTQAASLTIALPQHFKMKNKICHWTKE